MFKNTYSPHLVASLMLVSTACTLEVSDPGQENLGSDQARLYLTGLPGKLKWPNGTVPVCFTAASQTNLGANYHSTVGWVRDLAINSWPTAAKVDFTGWGSCPGNTNGMLAVELRLTGGSRSDVGYNASATTGMQLNVTDLNALKIVVPHEFGHAIGFEHEFQRFDWTDPCDDTSQANIAGDALGTPVDADSLLAATYCNNFEKMSAWDAFGAIKAYGRRVNAARPLVTAWSGARNDHFTAASDAGISNAETAGYSWAYAPGWLFTVELPGTVPLKIYWSASRQDNVTLASAQTQADVVAANYTLFGTEGYVFSSQQPGTVALKQYWSNSRLDHMLVIAGDSENQAIAAGYTFVRTEGYIPETIPYSLLWTYWSGSRSDNATTKQRSTLAQDLYAASYEFVGIDGAVWNYAYPFTSQLKNYWSNARLDHFALAHSTSESDAVAEGYTVVSSEDQPIVGYLYPFSVTGLSPMKSYWSSARTEHFTTIGQGAVALGQNYTLVRTEGWGLATN